MKKMLDIFIAPILFWVGLLNLHFCSSLLSFKVGFLVSMGVWALLLSLGIAYFCWRE